MLTPNEVKSKKRANQLRAQVQLSEGFAAGMTVRLELMLFREVLQEIAKGSIDPKSLALAALED